MSALAVTVLIEAAWAIPASIGYAMIAWDALAARGVLLVMSGDHAPDDPTRDGEAVVARWILRRDLLLMAIGFFMLLTLIFSLGLPESSLRAAAVLVSLMGIAWMYMFLCAAAIKSSVDFGGAEHREMLIRASPAWRAARRERLLRELRHLDTIGGAEEV